MWLQKLIKMASSLQTSVVSENDGQDVPGPRRNEEQEKKVIVFPPWCPALTTVNSESSTKVSLMIFLLGTSFW